MEDKNSGALADDTLDPIAKMPEYNVCAAKVSKK